MLHISRLTLCYPPDCTILFLANIGRFTYLHSFGLLQKPFSLLQPAAHLAETEEHVRFIYAVIYTTAGWVAGQHCLFTVFVAAGGGYSLSSCDGSILRGILSGCGGSILRGILWLVLRNRVTGCRARALRTAGC